MKRLSDTLFDHFWWERSLFLPTFDSFPLFLGCFRLCQNLKIFGQNPIYESPKTTSDDRKWCSKYPNNVETCFNVLGKDFLMLCLVNFDQKAAVLEHFSWKSLKPAHGQKKNAKTGGGVTFSPHGCNHFEYTGNFHVFFVFTWNLAKY